MQQQGNDQSAGLDIEGGADIDFGGIEEGKFELLPRGTYNCIIDSCEYGHSQSSGNPMWTLTLQVEDGDFSGRKLFAHMTFGEKGLPMTKRFLNRVVPELANSKFNPAQVTDQIVGKRCRAKVAVRPYEGEQRNNVKEIMAPGEGDGFLHS